MSENPLSEFTNVGGKTAVKTVKLTDGFTAKNPLSEYANAGGQTVVKTVQLDENGDIINGGGGGANTAIQHIYADEAALLADIANILIDEGSVTTLTGNLYIRVSTSAGDITDFTVYSTGGAGVPIAVKNIINSGSTIDQMLGATEIKLTVPDQVGDGASVTNGTITISTTGAYQFVPLVNLQKSAPNALDNVVQVYLKINGVNLDRSMTFQNNTENFNSTFQRGFTLQLVAGDTIEAHAIRPTGTDLDCLYVPPIGGTPQTYSVSFELDRFQGSTVAVTEGVTIQGKALFEAILPFTFDIERTVPFSLEKLLGTGISYNAINDTIVVPKTSGFIDISPNFGANTGVGQSEDLTLTIFWESAPSAFSQVMQLTSEFQEATTQLLKTGTFTINPTDFPTTLPTLNLQISLSSTQGLTDLLMSNVGVSIYNN